MSIPNIIAIDGPAASGKSTLGEKLANYLGYLYFDTGIMYRAVTWAALQALPDVMDEAAVTRIAEQAQIDVLPPSKADERKADVLLNGQDITWEIRSKEVETHVSRVSAYAGVRMAMTAAQRRIGQRGRVVMVGRDIGTVVLPEADLKVYLDASVEERARRRVAEVLQRGGKVTYEETLEAMKQRDATDSTRAIAPLKPANDAISICSDYMSIDEVLAAVIRLFDPDFRGF